MMKNHWQRLKLEKFHPKCHKLGSSAEITIKLIITFTTIHLKGLLHTRWRPDIRPGRRRGSSSLVSFQT